MPRFLWVLLTAAAAFPVLAAPPVVPFGPVAPPATPRASAPVAAPTLKPIPLKGAPAATTALPVKPGSGLPPSAVFKAAEKPGLTVRTDLPVGRYAKSTQKTSVPLAVTTPFVGVARPALPAGIGKAATVVYPRRSPLRAPIIKATQPLKQAPVPVATTVDNPSVPRAGVRPVAVPLAVAQPVSPSAIKGPRGPVGLLSASLLGQIRDEQGNPVVGATVSLGNKVARTDASGSYMLEKLTPGRWEVKVQHEKHIPKQSRIWLVEGLKTSLSLALVRPVIRQEATRIGLIGVGSLTQTDTLAQRLAEELLRTGAFAQVGPLQFIPRVETVAVVSKMERPLYEILDHDRPDPTLVKDFFDYIGVSALAVARVDMLTRIEGDANQLNSYSKVEFWQLKDGRVEIRTLVDAGRSEKHDNNLSKAETDQLYAIQVTQMATEVSKKWSTDSPLKTYAQGLPGPDGVQKTDTKVEIVPPASAPKVDAPLAPKSESKPQRPERAP